MNWVHHHRMVMRLNPLYPLVWRTPDTIQLGIDSPVVVVPHVTAALEKVIAALHSGVPREGAVMLGRQAGASDADISALLSVLRPALITTTQSMFLATSETTSTTTSKTTSKTTPETTPATAPAGARPSTVCVDGHGPTADRIRALLGDLGIPVQETEADPELAVVIGHYALEPGRHGRWLRRDIPHLPVVFSDSEVRVGPLIEPGSGPCLYCLELTHIDQDPAWPAIACQLLAREAQTETTRISIDLAARVAGLVQDRLSSGRSELSATSLVIDARTGMVRRRAHRPHERCGCRSLPENVIALAESAAAGQTPPSSARADGAPA